MGKFWSVTFVLLAACGDNNHQDAPDAALGVDASSCNDTVTMIQPGNPGSTVDAYPAAGWWSDDTRANGSVVVDSSVTPPEELGCTAAVLRTGESTPSPSADKAQVFSFALAGTPLTSITTISYWAYRSSASTGDPSVDLALNVSVVGMSVPTGFATLTYEPYHQSGGGAAILVDTWQHWDATATTAGDGLWWTTRIPDGEPGSQSNPQTWAAFQALFNDAQIGGYGFNLGSNNPNMVVAGDGLVFGSTSTNF